METIAIDFDGVLHEYHKGWFKKHRYGEPIDGALESVVKLMKKYEIIIFTCRPPAEVRVWLNKFFFPRLTVTNKKPGAISYIDDRGYKFIDWERVLYDYC